MIRPLMMRWFPFRTFAARRENAAKLLIASDLPEEAEPHQKAAEKALAEADGLREEIDIQNASIMVPPWPEPPSR